MSPELRDSLERIAMWHQLQGTATHAPSWHHTAAADIRAAIVSADDATKNMLCLRAFKAKDRRFTGEGPTGFGEL